MKVFVALLAFTAVVCAKSVPDQSVSHTAYGYLKNIGIPEAERIRKAEEEYMTNQRIVGGVPAGLGQYPYQAGLIISLIGLDGMGVCGGSLITGNRVLTAAHCWSDGQNQAWRLTVVLGTVLLFSGGTRVDTSVVAMHPNWFPQLARNDVAVIYLPSTVSFSDTISPVSLPAGDDLNNEFVGSSAIASGFGRNYDGASISSAQALHHVNLNVISNSVCSIAFPLILQPTNICTSGLGGAGTCGGDSGGPLVVVRDGTHTLIGVTSFGSALGCESALPAAFARVTSFVDFIQQHME